MTDTMMKITNQLRETTHRLPTQWRFVWNVAKIQAQWKKYRMRNYSVSPRDIKLNVSL